MDKNSAVYKTYVRILAQELVCAMGGTVMAPLGLITGILGFDASGTALMLAVFALQDSFGTACNVTGDGALTLMLEGLFNRNGELGPLQDVAPAEKI